MNGWHPADIKAAVEKTGTNLTRLAIDSGIHPAACRRALAARNIPGERAIAMRIGKPLWELWPDRWAPPANEGDSPIRIDNRRRDPASAAPDAEIQHRKG